MGGNRAGGWRGTREKYSLLRWGLLRSHGEQAVPRGRDSRQFWTQARSRWPLAARLLARPREAPQELWPVSLCQLCSLAWSWTQEGLLRMQLPKGLDAWFILLPANHSLSPAWLLTQPACLWRKACPSDTSPYFLSSPGTFICPCGCIYSVLPLCPASLSPDALVFHRVWSALFHLVP